METPFDTARSIAAADSVAPQPHDLRRLTSASNADWDSDDYTHWIIASVPNWWTDAEIAEIVDAVFPATRCTHEGDCCGHYYARKAQWAPHPARVDSTDRAIIISQRYVPNI